MGKRLYLALQPKQWCPNGYEGAFVNPAKETDQHAFEATCMRGWQPRCMQVLCTCAAGR